LNKLVHRTSPSARPDWDDPQLDFTKYSTSGVIGDPSYASDQLGSALWEASVNELAEMLHQFAEQSTPPVVDRRGMSPSKTDDRLRPSNSAPDSIIEPYRLNQPAYPAGDES